MEKSCGICNKTFASKEALDMHNKSKHPEKIRKEFFTYAQKKRIRVWLVAGAVIGIIVLIGYFLASGIKTLPPTTMEGHVEENPPFHVLKSPMPLPIHKHMLEHADGKGRPGVIINYNCEDFKCEEDIIEKLEKFAEKYPEHVYVAPYPGMDARITLTKLNQQKILDEYDEEVIDRFVQ